MTIPPAERRIRALLPLIRFMQTTMPLRRGQRFLKRALPMVRLPAGMTREAVSADGVDCQWIIPDNHRNKGVLLYLHGGGFVFGLTPQHLEMLATLSQKMSVRVLAVDYRLAPDFPYPAPLDDCVTAWHWLLKQGHSAKDVVVAGDSAGGNFTITMMMKLRQYGEPLPAAAACLSPVTDLSDKGGIQNKYKDPLLPAKATRLYKRSYVADSDPRDPLISPVFGDWHGLPPLLIHVGEDETLRGDAVRAAELAKAAGVDVRLEVYPRMWHVWQIFKQLPQTAQSLEDIAGFLTSHLVCE